MSIDCLAQFQLDDKRNDSVSHQSESKHNPVRNWGLRMDNLALLRPNYVF